MSKPQTAQQFNNPLTGESFTIRAGTSSSTMASGMATMAVVERAVRLSKKLDAVLAKEITHPCSYHPAGRNSLFLNPQERQEIIKRVLEITEAA